MRSTPRSVFVRDVLAAAAVVHSSITLFWAAILAASLPRRHAFGGAVVASAAIAVLDLRVIAPAAFPQVYSLPFWPQFADHLAWGACVGAVLAWRWRGA